MKLGFRRSNAIAALTIASASALTLAAATPAMAGGFAIREQSASSLGSAFAGDAANTDLSTMFWNPAGVTNATGGAINSESHFSVIVPRSEVTVSTVNNKTASSVFPGFATSTGIAGPAAVPASYGAIKLSDKVYLGISSNSGFGLVTKPDDPNYAGSVLDRTTKLFTANLSPTVGVKLSPWLSLGVGLQAQYGDGKLSFAGGAPNAASATFKGDGYAFGATAGIMLTPTQGTRIGLGWRSALDQKLSGTIYDLPVPGPALMTAGASTTLKLPDIVTLSINQAVAPNMRLLGTVEWSNWSRFKNLSLNVTGLPSPLVIDANWRDGWFFSVGGEYDYSRDLTLRTGIAYELSPVDDPSKRIVGIPDNNRLWLSAGASYKLWQDTSVDLGYSHIFVQNGDFVRYPVGHPNQIFTGNVQSSIDIVSVSFKTKWGGSLLHEVLK